MLEIFRAFNRENGCFQHGIVSEKSISKVGNKKTSTKIEAFKLNVYEKANEPQVF